VLLFRASVVLMTLPVTAAACPIGSSARTVLTAAGVVMLVVMFSFA
jgi:hypothetical protein